MASWRNDYIQALQDRDEREEASCQRIDGEFIEAYTTLLDQLSFLSAAKALQEPSSSTANPNSSNTNKETATSSSSANPPTEANPQLRADLTEALRSNGQLQIRLKTAETELTRLRSKTKNDSKTIETLNRQNAMILQKVRDRDEELKGKTKGFLDIQDEMISLNLQLNIAEQKAKKFATENQELIDRWMARKGREADEMNEHLR